jgi:hypothetical protein
LAVADSLLKALRSQQGQGSPVGTVGSFVQGQDHTPVGDPAAFHLNGGQAVNVHAECLSHVLPPLLSRVLSQPYAIS